MPDGNHMITTQSDAVYVEMTLRAVVGEPLGRRSQRFLCV